MPTEKKNDCHKTVIFMPGVHTLPSQQKMLQSQSSLTFFWTLFCQMSSTILYPLSAIISWMGTWMGTNQLEHTI